MGRRALGRRRLRRLRRLPSAVTGARARLKGFRQASIVAVALTGLLLLLFPDTLGTEAQAQPKGEGAPIGQAADEAVGTISQLWQSFLENLPKMALALGILLLAWGLVRLFRWALRRRLRRWEYFGALSAVVGVSIWFMAVGVVLSVLVGDIRALLGSLGLIGLALSWALQTPIESFTGWLLNSFKGYYRVGDRVLVGDVFGDVYRIDSLTTTIWEIGDPYRPGFVHAEQPTGRLVTFPNNEVLTGTVVNLTRDFPYVWDELAVSIANESDVAYAVGVFTGLARELLGDHMVEPAQRYQRILAREGLENQLALEPSIFVSLTESWIDLNIRYLVGARERRRWKSELSMRVAEEMNRADHGGRIIGVYPRRQVQLIGPHGRATEVRP